MEKKEVYNYKLAYEHPYVIRKLTKKIPVPLGGMRLSRFIIIVVLFLVELLFRNAIFALGDFISGLDLVVFLGVPFLLSGWLLKLNPDGKNIAFYLCDYMVYFFQIKFSKMRLSNDVKVLYMENKIHTQERR
ncbi:hypothetical protein HB885_11780 [Listeria seeligeri]|uniref:TcpE family conjugal transfer membrane protein n=1 Tax=Listeria seeligeri TaxID=1640 RepID=UPI001628E691|nr:TcpE family conjugal transfer membrane protein [Listeria seeligeri]EIY6893208.1 hypothetical protein [Listeria monocytogenes]MBC1534012.1 hypothetical protein [Listeria seeligeri]MBC1581568.1 hypothetical protein [Listeria seeligeri]MBC1880806.1 hypothetical protein [Listeria seeligeri]MBF2385983.1 hypothetical protein [Listeria seeligeri]